jgi:hypothetical protein
VPEFPSLFSVGENFVPWLRLAIVWSVMMAPLIAARWLPVPVGWGVTIPWLLVSAPLAAMAVLGVSVKDTLLGLSPFGLVRSAVRVIGPLLFIFVLWVLSAGAVALLAWGMMLWAVTVFKTTGSIGLMMFFGLAFWFVLAFLSCVEMMALGRALGLVHYHYEDRMELVRNQ